MISHRKSRLLLATLGAGVGVAAWVVWPKGPRLEWWTSSPIGLAGSQVRLRAMKPPGWLVDQGAELDNGHWSCRVILEAPPDKTPPEWMPDWLQRLLTFGPEVSGEVHLYVADRRSSLPSVDDELRYFVSKPLREAALATVRKGKSSETGVTYNIVNLRPQGHEFDAIYRQICESFQVIKEL